MTPDNTSTGSRTGRLRLRKNPDHHPRASKAKKAIYQSTSARPAVVSRSSGGKLTASKISSRPRSREKMEVAVPFGLGEHLLNRVNKSVALLAVFFNLTSIAIDSVNLLHHYEPLLILKGGSHLSALNPDQLHALAYIPLRLQSVGYDLSLAFFGFFCIFIGYLIFKSTFLPRIIGLLMAIAGLCYLTNSFVHFLVPQHSLFPYILVPCLVAELSLCLWLIVKGVNVSKWEQIASASRVGGA